MFFKKLHELKVLKEDIPTEKFIFDLKRSLQTLITLEEFPRWFSHVKTGVAKERVPQDANWPFFRMRAIIYALFKAEEPLGIRHLRKYFGDKKRRGVKKNKKMPASKSILTDLCVMLEKKGLVKVVPVKGRVLDMPGLDFIENVCKK
jgi:small subunit ribosomal protein S19e